MKTIGVFFGSRSTEHDISIITAQLIISGLKGLGYPVVPVYLTKKGEWMIDEALGELKRFTDPTKIVEENNVYKEYFLDLENSHGKLVLKKKGFSGKTVIIDIAFPALHGPYGEDGIIHGIFEMFDVPYVGCDVASSSLAMDKALTKQICQANGIPITKYVYFYKNEWQENKEMLLNLIAKKLTWPLFVKPVHLGSSIGITKVKNKKGTDLEDAIDVALYYDNKVLVEEGVENVMDATCCIVGNKELQASALQESAFQSDLFDFNEKYLKEGGSQLGKSKSGIVIPARVSDMMMRKIQQMAKEVYRALGCSGISRVDFLLNKKTNELFVAEVNPLPGTLYHHLWKASGVEFDELLRLLIGFAEERQENKKTIMSYFQSSVLANLNSAKLNSKGSKLT